MLMLRQQFIDINYIAKACHNRIAQNRTCLTSLLAQFKHKITFLAAKYEVSATKWYKIRTLSNCRVFIELCCLFALAGTICLCQGFEGFSCTPACRCVASRLIRHCTSMYNISHMPYTIAYRIRNCWMLLGLDSAIKWQSAGDIVAVLLQLQLVIVVVVVVVICHRSSVANCSSVKEGGDTEEGGKWDIREANCTCEGCSDCCTFWFQLTRGSFKWPFWVAADAAAVQVTPPPISPSPLRGWRRCHRVIVSSLGCV